MKMQPKADALLPTMPRSHLHKLPLFSHILYWCSINSPEKPLKCPRNGCAPECVGAKSRGCSFLKANECDTVRATIRSTTRVDAPVVADLSLTHQRQHSVKKALKPAF